MTDMLHPYVEASRIKIPFTEPDEEAAPGRELLFLLCGFSKWIEVFPSVQSLQGKTIYILYRNVAVLIDDFWEAFGHQAACINKSWPFCVFGTAQNQETVCISAYEKEKYIHLVQESISGKDADALRTLCFQIDCPDQETAQKLNCFLSEMNWQTGIAATSWKGSDFQAEHKLTVDSNSRSFFCYTVINPDARQRDFLYTLDFAQKIILWTAYLKDGFEPVEFEWLESEISDGTLVNRMEWELALRETMTQLNFRIINQEKSFEIFDSAGKRLYFGADGRHAAEWVLLKILFPLNY